LIRFHPKGDADHEITLRPAREPMRQAFLAARPEYLRRTLSDLSGLCKLRDAGIAALDRVASAARL
jgi:hypothetical protein